MNAIVKIIYDHWLIFLNLILATFGITTLWSYINEWRHVWVPALFILITVVFFVISIKRGRKFGPSVMFVKRPPSERYYEWPKVSLYGVNWKLWRGMDSYFAPASINDHRLRTWVDGPYCVDCDYEMDTAKNGKRWLCVRCQTGIRIPKSIREDTKEKIVKIFDADFRRSQAESETL